MSDRAKRLIRTYEKGLARTGPWDDHGGRSGVREHHQQVGGHHEIFDERRSRRSVSRRSSGRGDARDPATKRDVLQCLVTKHLVGLHFGDSSPLFQNSRAEARQENIYKTEMMRLPKEGTPVKLVFERVRGKASEGAKREHVFISGRVQGVGFR